jgi:hypothetical protein
VVREMCDTGRSAIIFFAGGLKSAKFGVKIGPFKARQL